VHRGDFNVTCFPSERSRAACRLGMSDFVDFLHDQGLLDLPLVGGLFTWSLAQDPPKWSRNDRFLMSLEWEAMFPNVSQKRLPRICSDHFPLVAKDCSNLRTCGSRRVLGVLVKHWWDSYLFQGSPSFVLLVRLKL
jgi:hypothetical protein